MKNIGILLLLFMLSSLAMAQKKDRTDAFMYNKNGMYDKAMTSIEKCINHEQFYLMRPADQARAWLYRATIYCNILSQGSAATLCPNAKVRAAQSLQKIYETDPQFAEEEENKKQIKDLTDRIGFMLLPSLKPRPGRL